MPNKRDLQLDQYEITKYRYRELYNFCLQYDEWKERLAECYSVSPRYFDGMPKDNRLPDPTARRAEKAIEYRQKREMIEQAANEAGGELYKWLLKGVTTGIGWEQLQPPCGERQYHEMRRCFFYLLSLKK